jgi:hypothetical protein
MNCNEELYNRLKGTLSALMNVRHIAEVKNWVWIVAPDLAGGGRNFAGRIDRLKQDRHAYTGRYSSRVACCHDPTIQGDSESIFSVYSWRSFLDRTGLGVSGISGKENQPNFSNSSRILPQSPQMLLSPFKRIRKRVHFSGSLCALIDNWFLAIVSFTSTGFVSWGILAASLLLPGISILQTSF